MNTGCAWCEVKCKKGGGYRVFVRFNDAGDGVVGKEPERGRGAGGERSAGGCANGYPPFFIRSYRGLHKIVDETLGKPHADKQLVRRHPVVRLERARVALVVKNSVEQPGHCDTVGHRDPLKQREGGGHLAKGRGQLRQLHAVADGRLREDGGRRLQPVGRIEARVGEGCENVVLI
jgi:hypothetical protein